MYRLDPVQYWSYMKVFNSLFFYQDWLDPVRSTQGPVLTRSGQRPIFERRDQSGLMVLMYMPRQWHQIKTVSIRRNPPTRTVILNELTVINCFYILKNISKIYIYISTDLRWSQSFGKTMYVAPQLIKCIYYQLILKKGQILHSP